MHLGFAIEAALLLAEGDIRNNNVYSMAGVAISSINSFLQSQKLILDFHILHKSNCHKYLLYFTQIVTLQV